MNNLIANIDGSHTRSEDVLVAGSQALETITLRCGALGRTLVQDALSTHPVPCGNTINCLASASERSSTATGRHASYKSQAGTVLSSPGDEFKGMESSSGDSGGCLGPTGAIGFALRLADAYGRDDSRTIVRRTGAARVGACAFNLVRALLSDRWGGELPDTTASEGGVPPDVVSEFCAEKVHDDVDAVVIGGGGRRCVSTILRVARKRRACDVWTRVGRWDASAW